MSEAFHEAEVQAGIARRIRAVREAANLTQEDAAERSGIDLRRWQRLEAGEANPTVRTLGRIAETCGVDFWSLVERTDL